MVLLETKKINISFSGIQILFDVDFELKEGEIHCVCGENGAGKSTLVKILTGIYPHYTGDVIIGDEQVSIQNPRDAREQGIYAVQQHRDLVPTLNAVENIFMGNGIFKRERGKQRLDFEKMRERSLDLISKFGVQIEMNTPVQNLKVSEQGIIAICKALAAKSKILLIDEASAPLDDAERQVLYNTLKKLRDEGKGIVYITHHLDEVFNIGDRVTVLRNGEKVATENIAGFDREKLIQAMTGNIKIYDRKDTDTEINQDDLLMRFDNVSNKHISDITFDVYKGEIIGFAGLEGSFKSEIASVAFGLSKYKSGMVYFKDKPLSSKHPIQSIRKGIGLVPTDRKNAGLITCRSVAENTILTAINKKKKSIVSQSWVRKVVSKNIKQLGIKTSGQKQLVEYLSGGNQQKVLLSKWLEAQVDLLFLVEPTEGIDVGARADLYEIFRQLKEDGKALVIFTSDIDELLVLSDRIFSMVEGRIMGEYKSRSAQKQTILSDILSKNTKGQGEANAQ